MSKTSSTLKIVIGDSRTQIRIILRTSDISFSLGPIFQNFRARKVGGGAYVRKGLLISRDGIVCL